MGGKKPIVQSVVTLFAAGEGMQGDPRAIPNALPSCDDITLFVLRDAGHNQNVAPNREQLWDRIAACGASTKRPGVAPRGTD